VCNQNPNNFPFTLKQRGGVLDSRAHTRSRLRSRNPAGGEPREGGKREKHEEKLEGTYLPGELSREGGRQETATPSRRARLLGERKKKM